MIARHEFLQLRRLRNVLFSSVSSEMDKLTFDQCANYAKDAFQALGLSTAPIDSVGSLTESDELKEGQRGRDAQSKNSGISKKKNIENVTEIM